MQPLFKHHLHSHTSLSVEGLREEEMIRSGSREQKKKTLPGGSGSGDLDDASEALLESPTILYPDPTTSAPTTGRILLDDTQLQREFEYLANMSD